MPALKASLNFTGDAHGTSDLVTLRAVPIVGHNAIEKLLIKSESRYMSKAA